MQTRFLFGAAIYAFAIQTQAGAQGMQEELQQKLTAVKEGIAQNKAALRQYTWTEQTNILLKGEVKKTTIDQCQYGPDGSVQKTQTGGTPPPEQKRGMRGRVIERKKDELESYMQQAKALIQQYVPPNPQQLEANYKAGNAHMGSAGPGTIQIVFGSYVKPGDSLVLTFNTAEHALQQVNVNTYMNDPSDAVTLQVNFQKLPGGPNYAAQTTLNATAKQIQVQTTSSNYQRMGQ